MGRLVNPMGMEEYEKLPGWQKWIGRHSMLFMFSLWLLVWAAIWVAVWCDVEIFGK